jgi:uncharacterized protein YjbI with pentapeptide repeats
VIESILNLTTEQKHKIDEEIGPLRSVTDFLSELLEGTKELPFKEKLAELLPWAAKSGEIVSEVTPLTKVLVKLVEEITKEKDPEKLGLLACSLAYQRSAALALALQGEPTKRVPFEYSLQTAKKQLKKLKTDVSLAGFSLDAPLAHPFIWQADDGLSLVVRSAGYAENEWRQIQLHLHDQFRADLVEVLSHGESAACFEPFTTRLSLGDNTSAYAALNAHIERQRWLFENQPVLNIEPFTLSDVYVDADCGKLQWKDFCHPEDLERSAGAKFDPFSEKFGGRHPLLETVLSYLRDPKFNDAIVIQGAPGGGKSSFTLRLANVLRREGLRPLRVRLKFLDLKKSLSEALAQVVLQPEEGESEALGRLPQCPDPFLNDSIFQERTSFGKAEICPYVLILDGWDEISVAVNEGFEIEVRRMLDNVRREFLRPRAAKVRVILTGRPSHAVERSQFLRDETPLLTVREYTPDQLETYAARVRTALEHNPIEGSQKWPEVNWDNLEKVFTSYRQDKSRFDILGLPLLAHLSLRLLAELKGESEQLLADRTALYRNLLDVTCRKAGKGGTDSDDLYGQARIKGIELRRMLQQTAVAITAYGNESIPFRELQLRLKKNRKETMEAAEKAGKDHPLTSLMISFYFKGGREHLGCEFLHKSFREYLYAEAVTEALREYGRKQTGPVPLREPYWKDFDKFDLRWQFSRDLCQLVSPYPLTGEISSYLRSLLAWEIDRSPAKQAEEHAGSSQNALKFSQWEIIRDGLNDLWDWWGEGVHLRPQPYRDDSDVLRYHPAFVDELLDASLPRDRSSDAAEWWPGRLVNADANVGDTLFRLNVWTHQLILDASGWSSIIVVNKDTNREKALGERPYQSRYRGPDATTAPFVLFSPSGLERQYFWNYAFRINAAGNRPGGAFPAEIQIYSADLKDAYLYGAILADADLSGADLSGAMLAGAFLSSAKLAKTDLSSATLDRASLFNVNLTGASLISAGLNGSHLKFADLSGADLSRADLSYALLSYANLTGASLTGADLTGADLTGADLTGADLTGVDLKKVTGLTQEQLAAAIIEGDQA